MGGKTITEYYLSVDDLLTALDAGDPIDTGLIRIITSTTPNNYDIGLRPYCDPNGFPVKEDIGLGKGIGNTKGNSRTFQGIYPVKAFKPFSGSAPAISLKVKR